MQKVKPNYRVVGKKLGLKMKCLETTLETLTEEDVMKLKNGDYCTVDLCGAPYNLQSEDVVFNNKK